MIIEDENVIKDLQKKVDGLKDKAIEIKSKIVYTCTSNDECDYYYLLQYQLTSNEKQT